MSWLRAWRHQCPICGAKPHYGCTSLLFGTLLPNHEVHYSRLELGLRKSL
jgi:hypothetical protein